MCRKEREKKKRKEKRKEKEKKKKKQTHFFQKVQNIYKMAKTVCVFNTKLPNCLLDLVTSFLHDNLVDK